MRSLFELRELLAVSNPGLQDRRPDLLLLCGGAPPGVGGVVVHVARFVTAIRAPVAGVLNLQVEPAVFLELFLVLVPILDAEAHAQHKGVGRVQRVVHRPHLVGRGAGIVRHAGFLGDAHENLLVRLALARRIDALDRGTQAACAALRLTQAVHLKPVHGRQRNVGDAVDHGRVPQVDGAPEIKLLQLLVGEQTVGLVHEVAGHAHAARHLVGAARLDGIVDAGSVGVALVAVGAHHREPLGAQADGLVVFVLELLHHHGAEGNGRADVHHARPRQAAAALTARNVHIARDAHDQIARTLVLQRVAGVLGSQHVLDAAVAVAGGGVHARGVGDGGLLQGLRVHAGDLRRLLGRVVLQKVDVVLPYGAHVHLRAVLELHFTAALAGEQRRIHPIGERRGIDDEALRLAGAVKAGLFGREALRGRLPVLAFPTGLVEVGVVPGQLIVHLVEHHEARVRASFLQVGLLQQTRLDGVRVQRR